MSVIVDVRSAGEFASGHLAGALHIPMEQLECRLADIAPGAEIVLVCQSGKRATLCQKWLAAKGVEARVFPGGINAAVAAGDPLVRSTVTRWSLERQVRLVAGFLAFAGSLLAALVSPAWLLLTGFVGAGLAFAGITGFCGMANLLALMRWNRAA